jgi:signal peptidase
LNHINYKGHLLRKVELCVVTILTIFVIGLPFIMGTSSYPISVVQGNSMYPTLQNGDLVLFGGAPSDRISNGTIILFVQSNSGIPLLDSLAKPVVIHRIIGEVAQPDGSVLYQTKGDNNQANDSQLIQANHVLGIPVKVIPKIGMIILFIGSPQGLVAIVAIIVMLYLGKIDLKAKSEEKKEAFLGALAQLALNDELPESVFRKFELAVKYYESVQIDRLTDNLSVALVDWMKKGGLETDWRTNNLKCPKCSKNAKTFESAKGNLLIVCSSCITTEAP